MRKILFNKLIFLNTSIKLIKYFLNVPDNLQDSNVVCDAVLSRGIAQCEAQLSNSGNISNEQKIINEFFDDILELYEQRIRNPEG